MLNFQIVLTVPSVFRLPTGYSHLIRRTDKRLWKLAPLLMSRLTPHVLVFSNLLLGNRYIGHIVANKIIHDDLVMSHSIVNAVFIPIE